VFGVVKETTDTGAGARVGPFESAIYALGVILGYSAKLGQTDVDLQLRWYREFDAQNHLEGNAIYLTAALKL
jgi:hypothetical protein